MSHPRETAGAPTRRPRRVIVIAAAAAVAITLLAAAPGRALAQGPPNYSVARLSALTDEILLVHVDEGYVDHHDAGETSDADVVYATPLDRDASARPGSYRITSPDDPAYASAVTPVSVRRKVKPTDFADYCQRWGPGCINDSLDHAAEHYLYLRVPSALRAGSTYRVALPGVPTVAPLAFTYAPRAARSEAVHVNQVGYVPGAGEKFGYVYHWMGDGGSLVLGDAPRAFELVDEATGATAFRGAVATRYDSTAQEHAYPTQAPPYGNLLRASVWECDFSAFAEAGAYRLCVEGVGCSFPFAVGDDVYAEVVDLAVEGLYQQRSGVALEAPYTTQPRPAPHNPAVTPGFAGRLKYSTLSAAEYDDYDNPAGQVDEVTASLLGPLDVAGWYQDAGDWDAYLSHAEVPANLLWLYEAAPGKWGDAQLNLPGAGNGLPDLLDEATWLPRFMYRLRAEMAARDYGTGGVGGSRVFGDLYGDDSGPGGTLQGSWEDTGRDWVVSAEDPWMTFAYAGLAAQIAWLLDANALADPEGIDWAGEARGAYAWAEANAPAGNPALGGFPLAHTRLFATAQLLRLTADRTLEATYAQDFAATDGDELTNLLLFGMAAYRTTALADPQATDPALATATAERLQTLGNFELAAFRDDRSARWGGNFFLPLIVGHSTTPLVEAGIVAHHFAAVDAPDDADAYRDALYSTADYFLGNNPLNQTYLTGLGERSPAQVFNLDSWVLGGETPRRGVTPYGAWSKEFLGFFQFLGPYHPEWPYPYAYPDDEDAWPAHERWFDQRTAPLTAEYTVHQQMDANLLTYGYLFTLTAPDFVASGAGASPASAKTGDALQLAPNPTRGIVRLGGRADATEARVLDARGAVVMRARLAGDRGLDLGALPAGAYTVELRGAGGAVRRGRVVRAE